MRPFTSFGVFLNLVYELNCLNFLMVDCLDLSEELKNFAHNGACLNLDER